MAAEGDDVEAARGGEPHDVAAARRAPQLVERAGGDQAAAVDDHDVVGDALGLGQVVGGDEHGDAAGPQLADDLADDLAAAHVDPGGRLVEERHLRLAHQGQPEGDPPLLAARQLAPGPPFEAGEAEPVDQGAHVEGRRVQRGPVAQHLRHPHRGVDAALLQHHADAGRERGVVAGGVEAEDRQPAPRRPAQALQALDGRGLAGAVGAEDAGDPPGLGRERQRVDRHHLAVGHAQRVDDDGRVHVAGRYPRPEPTRETGTWWW